MKGFLGPEFLLQTDTASELYHQHAKGLPIIDYHNHLPPNEVASNKQFSTITEVWLKGDHYKWRAMRANGIDERLITGDASDKEKFVQWAETVPHTLRNPLYHWTHLELQRYFGITELLSGKNAEKIYEQCNQMLADPGFSTQGLLNQQNVEVICTTDHPTDDLRFHRAFQGASELKMLPTFRPDKFIQIEQQGFREFVNLSGVEIKNFDDVLHYLQDRIEFFSSLGCKVADHGLSHLYKPNDSKIDLDQVVTKSLQGVTLSMDEIAAYQSRLLISLGVMYHKKGWTAQYHLGAIRNNNTRLVAKIGADVGCDSIGDYDHAAGLSYFLNELDRSEEMPNIILYNLNPRDNELFATMAGNFRNIQWGSAWWFLDQKDGMERQMNVLSNMGLLSKLVGMLTDSRSFLSFPRHEYFRRILCNLLGNDVENGEIPKDMSLLGEMVENICYFNAKNYFNF